MTVCKGFGFAKKLLTFCFKALICSAFDKEESFVVSRRFT